MYFFLKTAVFLIFTSAFCPPLKVIPSDMQD